jgi:release factor glutamine methyltransferase
MNASASVATLLTDAAQRIAAALKLDKREARIEARVLVSNALKVDHAWLIAHDRDTPPPDQQNHIESLIVRRTGGEPVAYILGEREFFGMNFAVTPAVLIPRPETELLVEAALQRLPENTACRILDFGTGSGAVAIALALKRPLAEIWAVEASPDALTIAEENVRLLNATNVHCIAGNWYETSSVKNFDIIVSNPPYIGVADPHLTSGDLRFEPRQALASGIDGLDDLRQIIAGAPAHLAEGGWLLLEHGWNQADSVRELMAKSCFIHIECLHDLTGHGRVTLGQWTPQQS